MTAETQIVSERVVRHRLRGSMRNGPSYQDGFDDGRAAGVSAGRREAAEKIKIALGADVVASASDELAEALAIGEDS